MLVEQINEVGNIHKKYNRLDKDFTFSNVDDNITGMKTACDILNSAEKITAKETVILEMYLEENYYILPDIEGQQELMKEIENTVKLPF